MNIAVSACLLGEKVRFDKGHKRDSFIVDELSKFAKFIRFCPEDLAFGSPRPTLRLVSKENSMIVESNKTGEDLSDPLLKASMENLDEISSYRLSAIIFKSKSPSCGLSSAKLYSENGFTEGKTDGLFAKICKERFPLLPMEEEGRLNDPWLRENFVMQVFAYDAFEKFKINAQMKDLVLFHQKAKFLLQSKAEVHYRSLGKIVGNHDKKPFDLILEEYEHLFKTTIAKKSSIKKTRNVLEHMAGFIKKSIDQHEKKMLHEQIEDYAKKIVPLIVPLSTLKIYATKYESIYLLEQMFLEPYPKELALRSDIKSGK
ncbi:YbgA family protein [Sulfurimonas sp.]|uniref:YbgA family protein n=1 Tax=Sulfurimonas sp. TaxID=2022749 RepID=UPI0035694566